MKTLRSLQLIIILIIIPSYLSSATMYMRNGEIHKGKIVGETDEKFFVKLEDKSYSIFFTHNEFKKSDIFCIIDDEGILRYPKDLTFLSNGEWTLPEEEFQRQMLKRQLQIMQDQSSHLKTIAGVLLAEFLIVAALGIAVAISK